MLDIVMSAQSDRTSDYLSWLFWDADGPEIKNYKWSDTKKLLSYGRENYQYVMLPELPLACLRSR